MKKKNNQRKLVLVGVCLLFCSVLVLFLMISFLINGDIEYKILNTLSRSNRCITIQDNDRSKIGNDQKYESRLYSQKEISSVLLDDDIEPIQMSAAQGISSTNWVLGINNDADQVVVNSEYFSSLLVTDATRISDQINFGRYYVPISNISELRALINFLFESRIIRTYWHLGSTICMIDESDHTDKYSASFIVSHQYCTNKCQSGTYTFKIEVDKKTGEILLLNS